ncbi:PQQ-binding-like beta-propeller repeat protein [Streptomyces sp. NPDC051577]|uniref:outer membrane protein assembly factor BamB family protein n=1 Tax=Streptomyces sp. NPDC051577 TaxID=3155166 RepID=UPI00343C0904
MIMESLNPGVVAPWLSWPGILIPVFVLALAITVVIGVLVARAVLLGRGDTHQSTSSLSLRRLPSVAPARPLPTVPRLPSWPTQGGSPSGRSVQGSVIGGPLVRKLGELWRTGLKGRAGSGVIGDGGRRVFVNSGGRDVLALDAGTGSVKWRFNADRPIAAAPAVHGSAPVCADYGGTLYSIDSTTRDALRRRHADYVGAAATIAAPARGRAPWNCVAAAGGVEALDMGGRLQWGFSTRMKVSTPLSADGGRAYLGNRDSTVYAVDSLTGSLLWNTRIGEAVATPAAVVGDSVYVSSAGGRIHASSLTGKAQRRRSLGGYIRQPLAVEQFGQLKRVFAGPGPTVVAWWPSRPRTVRRRGIARRHRPSPRPRRWRVVSYR